MILHYLSDYSKNEHNTYLIALVLEKLNGKTLKHNLMMETTSGGLENEWTMYGKTQRIDWGAMYLNSTLRF